MTAYTPALQTEYEALFATATFRPEYAGAIVLVADRILAHLPRYQEVEHATGVPAYVVGAIHIREASGNFACHLHNGDPLTGRTTHVPAGRPVAGWPPFTWVTSAIDALTMPGQALDKWHDWSSGGICFVLERYNGFGYRNHGIASPYLWGGTTAYTAGMYVADGVWSPTAVNKNPGAMAIYKNLLARGTDTPPVPEPVHPDLRIGAAGPAVAELQRRLTALGFPCGVIDSQFGKLTDEAAERFMKASGIWPGVSVDGSTWNAIAHAEAEKG